ncbi:O-antigen polymerase [Flavobacterium psychrophilum]|uniref:O-antigen polymerase n=1 Tax=Flavobacterium psychrophilum TaxID=96345 RepID=UPI00106D14E5|nr:O-antigen polymerase [Flavobacterium psychrophilum]MEB3383811.1 O-antigen polymerase [Flavobacterium psychrophilum]MEB3389684.1 O-antigen polymerase [Flavobacterium psychrophilum]MEB3403013.1 O-antigen polymerase [Flavobacterium psychrophilum]
MILYFILLIALAILFCFRKGFSIYFFSPTGLLCVTWMVFVFLKFLFAEDYFFSVEAISLFSLFIFSFFIGEFLMYFHIRVKRNSISSCSINKVNLESDLKIFRNKKVVRKFNAIILLTGLSTIVGTGMYVNIFVGYFGSITGVLTAGWALRGAMQEISLPLFVRAFMMLGYSSIILTLIYFIVYNKFKWYFLFPYISMLIMGITQAGRAGFIMILFQVFIMTYWREIFNYVINSKDNSFTFFNSPEYKLIKSSFRLLTFVIIIFVGGDMLRSQDFSFNSDILIQGFSSFKAYLFGGIAAFTTYLDQGIPEDLGWGRFSFSSLYELLGIHKNEIGIYTDYLRVSASNIDDTTNIFTAFRQYMDDFGVLGTVFFMMILGAFSHFFFQKAVKGDLASIGFMIVFYTYLFHTPLLSITVHNSVLISAILPYFIIQRLKKTII